MAVLRRTLKHRLEDRKAMRARIIGSVAVLAEAVIGAERHDGRVERDLYSVFGRAIEYI